MSQAAKAQEPSMEEILASIRRIIADDETAKPAAAAKAPEPPPPVRPAPAAPPPAPPKSAAPPPPPAFAAEPSEPAAMSQDDIDAMLAGFETAAAQSEQDFGGSHEPDVLELTEAMEARREAPGDGFRTIDASIDVVFTDPRQREPARQQGYDMTPAEQPAFDRALLSEQATAAVTSAFGSLAHTVLAQNARTLEDLVVEMLRPMLKTWLDDNLPTIVERHVRAEIERVSRGRT